MRVLIVMADFRVGGAEVAALSLLGALQGDGFDFTVATVRRRGILREAFLDAGVRLYEGVGRWRFDPLAPFRVARIVRREKIDAVIVADILRNGMLYGFVGSAMSGRKVARICWCHAAPGRQTDEYVWRLRMYRAAGLLDATVCVSRFLRDELIRRRLPAGDITIIHNAVDLGRFADPLPCDLPLPKDKQIIVQVANVVPWKDHETLLAAAGRLAKDRRDFHLVLVGRDTDSPSMARAVEAGGLGGFVTLTGHRGDVPSVLAAADIAVLATRCETFGIAALEGMAAGLPVIASDVEALEEVFTHGREGLKVPVGDAAALTGAIASLLDDRQLAARMGAVAKKRAESFALPRMAEAFRKLLRGAESPDAKEP